MGGDYSDGTITHVKPLGPGENYQIYDVVEFIGEDGKHVIHRIIDIYEVNGKLYLETQGDANLDENGNPIIDDFLVPQENVIGKAIPSRIPGVKRITHGKFMPRARAYGMAKKVSLDRLNPKISHTLEYTTLELIKDLMSEIQKHSEELAILFPDRVNKYSKTHLSRLIKGDINPDLIASYYRDFKKGKDKRFTDSILEILVSKLRKKYGEKALVCLQIVDDYKQSKIDLAHFVTSLCMELGRISGEVKFTYKEASEILKFSVNDKVDNIRKLSKKYESKFTLEDLENMVNRLEGIFAEKAMNMHKLINKYIRANKDLKEYRFQQHNVGKPHYFKELLSGENEKAYLLGFIGHDGSVSKITTEVQVKINPKDEIILHKIAKAINLDLTKVKIKHGKDIRIYKGQLREYYYAILKFGCKPMNQELQEIGDMGCTSDTKEVPPAIKELVRKAKQKNIDKWMFTEEGQTALAWLLGSYDADGSMTSKTSGRFFSSNKEYLYEIKELFGLKGKVIEQIEPGTEMEIFGTKSMVKGCWSIHISSNDVFSEMMNSHSDSLQRKRPEKFQRNSGETNYLG